MEPTPSIPPPDVSPGREAILDAAESLFAARGFSGTSLRNVAREASVSQALIHHHFGTKAELWAAVKARFAQRIEGSQELAAARVNPATTADPVATLTAAMRGYAAFLKAHPNMQRVATWAHLEGDDAPWQERSGMLDSFRADLLQAQRDGVVRADLDVGLHLCLVGAAVDQWVHHAARLVPLLQLDGEMNELADRYFAQAARTILLGALPDDHAARVPGDDR